MTSLPEPTEADIAYLAGLIDGEGCISINRWIPCPKQATAKAGRPYADKTPRYMLTLRICMTDVHVIYWLQDRFGGRVTSKKRHNPNHRPLLVWVVTARQACQLLKQALPYLKTKANQAVLAVYFQDHLIRRRGWDGIRIAPDEVETRDRMWEALKALNHGFDPDQEEEAY